MCGACSEIYQTAKFGPWHLESWTFSQPISSRICRLGGAFSLSKAANLSNNIQNPNIPILRLPDNIQNNCYVARPPSSTKFSHVGVKTSSGLSGRTTLKLPGGRTNEPGRIIRTNDAQTAERTNERTWADKVRRYVRTSESKEAEDYRINWRTVTTNERSRPVEEKKPNCRTNLLARWRTFC